MIPRHARDQRCQFLAAGMEMYCSPILHKARTCLRLQKPPGLRIRPAVRQFEKLQRFFKLIVSMLCDGLSLAKRVFPHRQPYRSAPSDHNVPYGL